MTQDIAKKDYPRTFKRNMEQLQALQLKLAERIYEYVEEHGFPEPTVKETPSGMWCSGLSERPFFQPGSAGKITINRKKHERPRPVVMVYGAGFPPYLTQVLRTIDKSVLAVIVFEPSLPILVHTLAMSSVYNALPQFARVSFVINEERVLLEEALRANVAPLGTFPITQADIVEHIGECELFQKEILDISYEFRKVIRVSIEKLGNTAEDTLIGVRNMCLNAPWVWHTPSLVKFKEKYEGVPIVTVASGPSLEKNFRLLKTLKRKCLILCADTALPKLLKENILPHIVITLERPFRMYSDYFRPIYENHYDKCKDILLLAEGVSPPQIVGRWPGPVGVIGKIEIPVDKWIMRDAFGANMFYSGASVMHVALSIAAFCKASSVAMIGQDLAYGEDGASHSDGIISLADESIEQSRRASGYDVEGVDGNSVRTSLSWLKMLQVFEDMVASFPFDVFDCTQGGARIHGTTLLNFCEYIDKHLTNEDVFDIPPHLFFSEIQKEIVPSKKMSMLSARIMNLLGSTQELRKILLEIEAISNKVLSPGLSPETRRTFALESARKLDMFHAKNSAVAFVGQSYANVAGAVFASHRFMVSQKDVEEWKTAWDSVINAHEAVLTFLDYWFEYLLMASRWYKTFSSSSDFLESVGSCPKQRAQELASEIFGKAEGLVFDESSIPDVTSFLARTDGVMQDWEPLHIWRAALFLEQQKRFEQASYLMDKAALLMENKEMPHVEIGSFLFDYTRVSSEEDLCHFPNYRKALSLLDQTQEYFDLDDPKMKKLSSFVRESYGNALSRYKEAFLSPGETKNAPENFRGIVMDVERFMALEELDVALKELWAAILCFGDAIPLIVRPYFQWLVNLLPHLLHSQDEEVRAICRVIFEEIGANLSLLQKTQIALSGEFIEILKEKGISFASYSAEKG